MKNKCIDKLQSFAPNKSKQNMPIDQLENNSDAFTFAPCSL